MLIALKNVIYVAEVLLSFEIMLPPLTRWDGFISYRWLIKKLGVYFLRVEKASPVCNKISWELVSQLLQVDS